MEFGIDILDEDIDRLCSVADVVAYIEKKIKQALTYFFLYFDKESSLNKIIKRSQVEKYGYSL